MTNPFPKQLILGHRGSPLEATENTLRSLALAIEAGADGVEMDVQRSRDGVPVVIHDDTLNRTTPALGRVSRLDWPAIERLTNGLVPSFAQVAAWAAASGAWLNVELKAAGVEAAVIDLISDVGLRGRAVLSSFDSASVRRIGEVDPDIRRFLLSDRWDAGVERVVRETGAAGVCLRVDAATDTALEFLAELDLPVIVWTVNEPERVRHLLEAGVAGLISDDPSMAARERVRLARG